MTRACSTGLLRFALIALLIPSLCAAEEEEQTRIGVLAFARDGISEHLAVQFEEQLRALFQRAKEREGIRKALVVPIELRYDIGYLSKANLVRSRSHFNNAQRALETGDLEETKGQLFRAQLFYNKGVPFVSDRRLLTSIYYYRYRHAAMREDQREARELYCKYVSLSRNLTGSPGTIAQYLPLQQRCGETKMAGTGELIVQIKNVDGVHLYINNQPIATLSQSLPYNNPFMSAGVHLVELRRAGYTRWGKLITLKTGTSMKLRGRLRRARNRNDDYDPLASIPLRGEDAYSPIYLNDFLFRFTERFSLETLALAYLEGASGGKMKVTILTFHDGQPLRFESTVAQGDSNGFQSLLSAYWKESFSDNVPDLNAAQLDQRWAPTIFRVD